MKNQKRKRAGLKLIKVSECRNFAQLKIDFIGPLPKSNGKKYIITGTCRATKFTAANATNQADAKTVKGNPQ